MENAADYRNTWLDRVCDNTTSHIKDARYRIARRAMEHRLEKILLLAQGYEKQGLAPDHNLWVTLRADTQIIIDGYCQRWNCTQEDILKDNPGLIKLVCYTPPPAHHLVKKATGYILLGMIGLWLMGALGGLVASGYHFVISHLR